MGTARMTKGKTFVESVPGFSRMTAVLWVCPNLAEEIINLCVLEILCYVLSVQEAGSSLEKQEINVREDHLSYISKCLYREMITVQVLY